MFQTLRLQTHPIIYVLIFSYSWVIVEAPLFDFFYSVAHTASVMNAQLNLDDSHDHSQEIMASDLEKLKITQEEEKQKKRQSIMPDLEKQIKILNPIIKINPLKDYILTSNFPLISTHIDIYLRIPVPPPRSI